MTQDERERIQRQGANARALGKNELDNPYLRSDKMPTVTGQTKEEWAEFYEAWKFGWVMENAMRR